MLAGMTCPAARDCCTTTRFADAVFSCPVFCCPGYEADSIVPFVRTNPETFYRRAPLPPVGVRGDVMTLGESVARTLRDNDNVKVSRGSAGERVVLIVDIECSVMFSVCTSHPRQSWI